MFITNIQTECSFNLLLDDSPPLQIEIIKMPIGTIKIPIGTIKMPIGTNNWDVDTYRNKLEKVCCIYLWHNV